jgi:TatD DNase family protein
MILVDTHCHLQDAAFDEDRAAVLERALETLSWLVISSDNLATSRKAVALTGDRVFTAVGVHPYHAATVNDECLEELRHLSAEPGVVAIGEMGLDYFKYCDTPKPVQHEAFRRQLALACDLGLPVTIHDREAHEDCLAILSEFAPQLVGCIMHCFSGDAALAERYLTYDQFYISFAGNVTFPKAQALRDAAHVVPVNRLLVETDSPYLAPQPVRGKRCEPANVQHTAAALAALKGVAVEAFAEATTENAQRLFNINGVRD